MLRDILHYTDDDIRNLSLIDLNLAMHYSLETYVRRDTFFVMSKIYGKGKSNEKGKISFTIEHPEIEAWIKEQYKEEKTK